MAPRRACSGTPTRIRAPSTPEARGTDPAAAVALVASLTDQAIASAYEQVQEVTSRELPEMPAREQVTATQQHQLGLAWLQLVSEVNLGETDATSSRRRALLLALPAEGPESFTLIASLNRLNPDLAALYAVKTPKTMTRDINALEQAGLIVRNRDCNAIRPRFE